MWENKDEIISEIKNGSGDESHEELTSRSCCGPLLYFSLQIDGQCKSWRCHIFLEEKGLFTAPYFPYSLFPFIDFLIDFYSIQPEYIKYIQIRRGTWHLPPQFERGGKASAVESSEEEYISSCYEDIHSISFSNVLTICEY